MGTNAVEFDVDIHIGKRAGFEIAVAEPGCHVIAASTPSKEEPARII